MTENRNGQVVTFYSFKGGTGRTMALANVAWILAESGKRVLVADWDLESPGLHRFFHPFLDPSVLRGTGGIIDMIRAFEAETTKNKSRPEGWEAEFARVERFAFSLKYTFPGGGSLDFLSAGRQNQDYAAGVSGLDWDVFYDRLGGASLFDALRADMKHNYDYALIDSRTGLSDVANICTIHLPDVLVDCFTFSEQGIDGAAMVAREVAGTYATRKIRVLPVPMRVDLAEKDKADAGRSLAMHRFANLPSGLDEQQRQRYWSDVEVPYHAYYAYEETLATFGDRPNAKGSLLSAYENLTSAITEGAVTSLPAMDEAVRTRWRSRFERKQFVPNEEIVLRYVLRDQVWAEWIERVLAPAGIRVIDSWETEETAPAREALPTRTLTIVSSAYAESPPDSLAPPEPPGSDAPLAVYVDDVRPLAEFQSDSSVFLDGLSAVEAANRLLQLIGRDGLPAEDPSTGRGARFPGTGPELINAPVANVQFTGREYDLRELRRVLRLTQSGGSPLVVLHGLGGVGKTQIALEYVHRFRGAYDLIWWVGADPALFIDTALGDLGKRMGLPEQANLPAMVRAVLDTLGKGEAYPRWLLVFDNAEEFEEIKNFLPQGVRGHVLVTSRNQTWGDSATSLPVDVFHRRESIEHLRRRVPGIPDDDADRVAEALGDLPIALAVGGALLAASGTTVGAYLEQIAEGDASLESNWDLSLNRLREESPAAYRLLELCSVLAPEIALDLLNSRSIGQLLRDYDPSVPSRWGAAKLIQQINRLALLKLDTRAQQIRVHRLLQGVVRGRMAPDELSTTRQQVLSALAAARPEADVDDADGWPRYQMLWPHLEVTERAQREALESDDPALWELLVDRVRYVWLRGGLVQGGELARRIDQVWSERIGSGPEADSHPLRTPLLRLRFNLANILREQGRFDEAHALDEATLEQQRQLLGESHTDTLMTAGGLAADLRALGFYGQALERDQGTHAAWALEFGEDYPRTLAAQNNLAASWRLTGNFAEARRLDELTLERRRIVLGRDNYWTYSSASMLARDLREAGDYERSVALLRDVVSGLRNLRGPNAAATLSAQGNLAVSLRSTGEVTEAARLLGSTYETLRQHFGEDHPETLSCRLSRATTLLALGDAPAADAELREVKKSYTQFLGPEHPHTLVCESNLAVVARARGDRQRALASAAAASNGLAKALHAEHPFLLASVMNLAVCRAEADDIGGALELAERLIGQMRKALGAHHPDTLRCGANLALIRLRLGNRGYAVDESSVDVRELASVLGASHPDVQTLQERRLLDRVLDPHPF
ncbi:FxSxx-COOH system tetratricopeptide repeat protein [Micromonospora sp. NPDC049559]|uniref:FxSxx-COOH system tetratricopeptide repeat protein n=1 Tax=Micromonospora sp. NPDC049559 TaxID=3155923 RepID=UPI00342187D2